MNSNYNNWIRRALACVLALVVLLCTVACGGAEEGTETETFAETVADAPVKDLDGMAAIHKGDVNSDFVFLCERESMTAVAGLRATDRMYPASITKVMTFIVAYENSADLTELIEITADLKNQYADGSRVGIDVGDLMTVEQMMYALLLSSDTDAALGLAIHVAGSEAAFVSMMNAKAEELALKNTHFANVTGLHSDDHYSTPTELAVIVAYALNIPLGRTILTTDVYETYLKYYKQNGVLDEYRMTFYNSTLRGRFADNKISTTTPAGTVILGGKTGFTDEADQCLATVARAADGREYILITGHASTKKETALDAVTVYDAYVTQAERSDGI